MFSPNQVLTHTARAVAARGAREGLWLEQGLVSRCDPLQKNSRQQGLTTLGKYSQSKCAYAYVRCARGCRLLRHSVAARARRALVRVIHGPMTDCLCCSYQSPSRAQRA